MRSSFDFMVSLKGLHVLVDENISTEELVEDFMKEKKRKKVRGRLQPLFVSALQSMTQQRDHTLEDSPDHSLKISCAALFLLLLVRVTTSLSSQD
ncbi:uncharacterized protein ACBT57_007988 isoform 1-T19 [Dama dama]